MPESSNVLDEAVKQKGYFNYAELYRLLYELIKDEEGYNISEKAYTEKVSSFGKEIEIEWECEKKISDYFKNKIVLKWHILGMNDAEVEINGKKEKINKGEVKIKFKADLVSDYEEKWEKQPFYKFLRGVYDKYIIRTTKEEYEDRLQAKAESIIEETKSFLMLEGKK